MTPGRVQEASPCVFLGKVQISSGVCVWCGCACLGWSRGISLLPALSRSVKVQGDNLSLLALSILPSHPWHPSHRATGGGERRVWNHYLCDNTLFMTSVHLTYPGLSRSVPWVYTETASLTNLRMIQTLQVSLKHLRETDLHNLFDSIGPESRMLPLWHWAQGVKLCTETMLFICLTRELNIKWMYVPWFN